MPSGCLWSQTDKYIVITSFSAICVCVIALGCRHCLMALDLHLNVFHLCEVCPQLWKNVSLLAHICIVWQYTWHDTSSLWKLPSMNRLADKISWWGVTVAESVARGTWDWVASSVARSSPTERHLVIWWLGIRAIPSPPMPRGEH